MERFKFKTRGMRNPQGIPRVLYCCHSKDFERFFESVSDEILTKQNCAVFYDSMPDAERDEQFYLDLKQMQLFVMPVSSELLYTENSALSVLFPFAIENHIPVLPLMQESGLEQIFNEKCGDLQFLDKNANDSTAISYDEKLEKYLSSVLIGDEMAEKIRNAFDAYVFLSYRKKDRKYAQELMRLIHKNDFCRDIAIWYDEFLTPGEDFNDSIKAAFEKSGLFVLAVTPNLVNEVNYVMTIEYPMAKEAGKPILPAELVETDKNLLAEKYEGIPECTDAYNDEKLTTALFESVKNIAINENDKNPEHNFFIGLAYLGGVDVEVDHEKAVELITFAAEHNVVEAIDKLVEMYRTGYGVERDYLKAIEWQEKKTICLEKIYNGDPTEDNQNKLFWGIITCGDYYKELAKLSAASDKYKQAQSLYSDIEFAESTDNAKQNYYVSFERMGQICKSEGNLKKARDCYEKSLQIFALLAECKDTLDSKTNLSILYNHLGDICKAEGNLKDSMEYYQKSIEIRLGLAEETDAAEYKRILFISYNKLGAVCTAEGNLKESRKYFEKCIEICSQLVDETVSAQSKRYLAVSYNALGSICKAEGNLKEARKYYEKGLEIHLIHAEELVTIESKMDLSISYERLGNVCSAEGNLKEAREYHEKCLEIRTFLAEKTDTVEAKSNLTITYNKLGDICKAEGNLKSAREYYEKSLEIRFKLVQDTDTVESKLSLANSYERLGNICRAEGNLKVAREYHEKCLEIRTFLAEKTDTVEAKRNLTITYYNLGDICKAEGNLKSAREYYEKSLNIRLVLAEKSGAAENYSDLAVSYYKLAFCDDKNKKQYLKDAIDIYEMLVENCPDIALYRKNLEVIKRHYLKACSL